MLRKNRFWLISCALGLGLAITACDNNDSGGKKVPSECLVYPDCNAETVCQGDEDFQLACSCSDDIQCMINPDCNGKGTCKVDCKNKSTCKDFAACNDSKDCYGTNPGECDPDNPGADNEDPDNDGLSNRLERYLNTNPCLADTDGDTIPDGVEDANRNGKIEPEFGETNPTNPADPPQSGKYAGVRNQICTYEKMLKSDASGQRYVDFGNVRVAKLDNVEYRTISQNYATIFNDDVNKVYGFVFQDENMYGAKALLAHYTAGLKTEESNFSFPVPLESWLKNGIFDKQLQVINDHDINRLKFAIEIDEGSSVAKLRNTILAGNLTRDSSAANALNALTTTDTCDSTTAKVNIIRSIHKDYSIVSFVATCETDSKKPDVQNLMENVHTGTLVAPNNFIPFQNFVCQTSEIGDSSGMVDFFWIIDNSGSMKDEQENVTSTVDAFAQQLKLTNIDYRLAVSTTDAYVLKEAPTIYSKLGQYFIPVSAHKLLMRSKFFKLTNPATMGLFKSTVSVLDASSTPNIKGVGYEDGIESALLLLKDLKSNPERGIIEPGYNLREGAINYIIWVTDEESRQFKEDSVISDAQTTISDPPKGKICRTGYEITEENGTFSKASGVCKEEDANQADLCTGEDEQDPELRCAKSASIRADVIDENGNLINENVVNAGVKFDETASLDEIINASNADGLSADEKIAYEQYAKFMQYYIQEFQKFNAVAFALVGDKGKRNGGVCDVLLPNPDATDGADYGLSYMLLARLISSQKEGGGKEGGFASICSTNYETTVSEIISDAVGRVASHPLKGYPIASTIRVSIERRNGTVIELPQSSTKGWQYDPSQNAIILYGVQDEVYSNSALAIAYVIWSTKEG
ncbi:MAG: hypothetical protein WC966_01425 [Bradymonadales bacterium]|jgi:hypothetical protein